MKDFVTPPPHQKILSIKYNHCLSQHIGGNSDSNKALGKFHFVGINLEVPGKGQRADGWEDNWAKVFSAGECARRDYIFTSLQVAVSGSTTWYQPCWNLRGEWGCGKEGLMTREESPHQGLENSCVSKSDWSLPCPPIWWRSSRHLPSIPWCQFPGPWDSCLLVCFDCIWQKKFSKGWDDLFRTGLTEFCDSWGGAFLI